MLTLTQNEKVHEQMQQVASEAIQTVRRYPK